MVSLVVLPGWYLSIPPSAHTEELRVGGLAQAGAVDVARPVLRDDEERAAGPAAADAHAREELEGRDGGRSGGAPKTPTSACDSRNHKY